MTASLLHIPEFAVLGHPNEGKSSVVSTLTEDDQIRVSQIPGETSVSRTYTVEIDGEKIIRFVDTPGFQAPRQTLAWFRAYAGDPEKILDQFIERFYQDPFISEQLRVLGVKLLGVKVLLIGPGLKRPGSNFFIGDLIQQGFHQKGKLRDCFFSLETSLAADRLKKTRTDVPPTCGKPGRYSHF